MLQLVYISSANPTLAIDLDALLAQSQANNLRDGITGLLFTDGKRFLQALEGEKERVEDRFLRIRADPRHRAVVVLHRRMITEREFGAWSMARRTFDGPFDAFSEKVAELCRHADPSIQGTFRGLIEVRQARG
jgi:hypothetical protein